MGFYAVCFHHILIYTSIHILINIIMHWFQPHLPALLSTKCCLVSEWVTSIENFSNHGPSWGCHSKNNDYMRGTSCVIYMLNYTFHNIQNTGMNHISPLCCRRSPPACLLDPFQGLCVCLQAATCSSVMCNVYWWSRKGASCCKPHSFA